MTKTPKTPGAAPVPVAGPAHDASLEGLPNAIDIDAKAIPGPVLTRQGWVVPAESPKPKNG